MLSVRSKSEDPLVSSKQPVKWCQSFNRLTSLHFVTIVQEKSLENDFCHHLS